MCIRDRGDEGHLIPMKKAHGRKKALKELVEMMRETVEAPEGQTIFIGHGDCAEDAELVARLVRCLLYTSRCV